MTRTTALTLAAGLALAVIAPHPAARAQPDNGELPVTGITLYRSGVGSFERRGLVEGDAQVQLRFNAEQINDILKSMVLLDLNGGRIDGVSYASKEPLERRLASFGINIADQPSLGTILTRLRGVRARFVRADGSTVEGTILGGETRPEAQGQATEPILVPYVNVVTDAGIRSVNLNESTSVEILDREISQELSKALAALAEHRADRSKAVDISLSGDGARQIVVAYVHEMPIWKTSYRLVLPDAPALAPGERAGSPEARAKAGGQLTIQGWAIVENTTDEDWNNIRLSLVAGRPVSFEMDLYEPLFLDRPEVPVPVVAGVAPRMYEGAAGYEGRERLGKAITPAPAEPVTAVAGQRRAGWATDGGAGSSPFQERAEGITAYDLADYAAQAQARAGEAGEVFFYRLENPVTIERQRSAMLPILASAIDGRRVSIFNPRDGSEHPMRGVELTNSTDLQLMPGPISVYDGGAYAGDAQIGHVPAGDKRLLAYAVDLDVVSLVNDESTSDVRQIKLVDGLVHQTLKQRNKVTYAFTNKDAKRPRTILVEHPKLGGWDLAEPGDPYEQTDDLYRFELDLDPSGTASLPVVQERTYVQTYAVTDADLGTLIAHQRGGKVSQAVIDAVREAARRQAAINEVRALIARLDQERAAIDADQSRIRQNMSTVSRDTDLYRRYMAKLNEQESRLEALIAEREEAQATLVQRQKELNDYVRGLNVE